ncbi:MAG: adenylate/guanylate cyclase domain-containing protein, partial [Proteobacteria bacterium]|nr:adenylate/guanylate cyclase domain-containing protein [Pseudomonadota bacterium]
MSGTDTRKNRKTSTILAMDVVGYSEKMSSDEEGTINQLRACRVIIEDSVKSYQGRIFNTAGDAFMVEFNSALSAVRAAIEIQEKVFTHNQNHDGHKGLEFRMGINMGDVVVDGENLLGDGVNVAARLEGIAPPGGICISEIVHSVVKGKVPCGFIDQGTQNLKNISEPVRAYYADTVTGSVDPKQFKHKKTINKKTLYYLVALAVVIAVGSYVFQGMQEEVQNGADFQRIAILPFDTGSQDQNLLNFANGLTEDLSAGFSKAAKKLTLV